MLRLVALVFTLFMPLALIAGDAPAPVTPVTPKPVVVNAAPKPFLGVKVDENASNFDPSQGLPVSAVIPGSTAATMGVQVGDLLRTFNGAKLSAEADLAAAIGKTKVGDEISVDLTRVNGTAQDKLTLKGQIAVRPQVASINTDIAKLREEVLALRKQQDERRAKELSLADMLKMLKEIEDNMPAAVAEFKKQYPKGEFNIQIKIDIVSDKTAKEPITIGNQPDAKLNPGNVNAPVDPGDKPQGKPKP
ncbi:MAG: PDZ domain-containing protein [Planctomycetes bacterium]|nr:PDZ domain-containing protein [Planctomycetota bacterium]